MNQVTSRPCAIGICKLYKLSSYLMDRKNLFFFAENANTDCIRLLQKPDDSQHEEKVRRLDD